MEKIMKSLLFLFLVVCPSISPSQSKPTLTLSPQTLNRSGDSVLIQWSGIPSPSSLDWLGIYSPPTSSHNHFLGYVFLSRSSTWMSGYGSISLPLTNLRANYSFRIFRWTQSEVDPKRHDHDHNPLPGTRNLLVESESLGFASGATSPEQVHLAYTDNVSEMRVTFVAGNGEERYVRYGKKRERFVDVGVARASGRYEREHMCDSPANSSVGWRDPGWVFDGVMKRLKGGLRYYYQVRL